MKKRSYRKVLLIFPPVRIGKPLLMPPLGVTYLASVIIDKYEVHILDAYVEGYYQRVYVNKYFLQTGLSYDEIEEEIVGVAPDVVGITTLFSSQWPIVEEIIKRVKKIDPGIITVTGGTHPSFLNRECMKDKNLDFIIIGEGEYSFRDLLDTLNSRGELSKIDGLAYRKNNAVYINPKQEYIEDLDELPIPSRELLPLERYFEIEDVPAASVITSRGCVNNCIFCSSVNFWGRRWRPRNPEKVVDEIEYLNKNHNITKIYFEDDHLLFDIKRAKEIFRGIINRHLGISWITPNGIFPQKLDDELIHLMKKSGCKSLTFAIESGSERVRNTIIGKKINLKETKETIKNIKKAGISTDSFFIIGFPGERKEDILETIKLATSSLFDYSNIFIATPHPGTLLYQKMKSSGLLNEKFSFENNDYSIENIFFSGLKKGDLSLIKSVVNRYVMNKRYYTAKKDNLDKSSIYRLLQSGNFSLKVLTKTIKMEKSKQILGNIWAMQYLMKEIKMSLQEMVTSWVDWLGDDIHLLVLSSVGTEILKEEIKGFIEYLCKERNVDSNFYNTLVEKQLERRITNAEETKI